MARVLDQAALVLLRLGQAAQHAVEGAAEPGHLVAPGDRHLNAQSPGAGHVLGGRGEPDQPPRYPPGQPPAEQSRRDHNAADQQERPLLKLAQQILRVAELLRDLHRAPPVAEGDGRHPVEVAGHLDLLVLRQLPGRGGLGDLPVRGGHRQHRVPPVRDRATGAEHLHVRTAGPDDVVERAVVVGVGGGEVLGVQCVVPHLFAQVVHDLREHGLLVQADQPGGGVVAQEADEDGHPDGHRRERQREGGAQ
uniref:Uncharacterized protein n=1 Tax=Streptomyces avermitilis TaxID=33903 RepID=A0A499VEE9_STRAX|nr:hypothetical protein SAVMC3_54620 [Streptomyces avermitilis]